MQLFQQAERNAIERTRSRILWFIVALSAAGEAGLIVLDIARDRDITNNLIILLCLVASGLILSTRRITLAAYFLLTPFAIDFMRVVVTDGIDTHALPLLFLLVVEAVYFLPTFHALLYVGLLMAATNGAALLLTPEADLNQTGRLLVVADAIVLGITAIFTTVFVSMKRYFGSLTEQNKHLDELVRAAHQRSGDRSARGRSSFCTASCPSRSFTADQPGRDHAGRPYRRRFAVLFADLSGFTRLSREMDPDRLVALLNTIFSEMDRLADRHGLEKIKTIGDAYMVAAGVPEAQEDGLVRLADFALDLRDLFEQKNQTGRSSRVAHGPAYRPGDGRCDRRAQVHVRSVG